MRPARAAMGVAVTLAVGALLGAGAWLALQAAEDRRTTEAVAEARIRWVWDDVDLRFRNAVGLARAARRNGCGEIPPPPAQTRPVLVNPSPGELASAATRGQEQLGSLVRWDETTKQTLIRIASTLQPPAGVNPGLCGGLTRRLAREHIVLDDLDGVPQHRSFRGSGPSRQSLNLQVLKVYGAQRGMKLQRQAIAQSEKESHHPDKVFVRALRESGLSLHYRTLLWQDTFACDAAALGRGTLGAFGTSRARLEEMGLTAPEQVGKLSAVRVLHEAASANHESHLEFLARCTSTQVDELMASHADDPRAYAKTLVPHVVRWLQDTERHFRRGHRPEGEAVLLTITAWRAGRLGVDDWMKRAGVYWDAPPESLTWVQILDGRPSGHDPKESRVKADVPSALRYLLRCLTWSLVFSEAPEAAR